MIGLAKLAPGEGNVDLTERPVRAPEAGEVALDVVAAGICGTDLHIWLGEYDSVPPVTMGHEVCGIVAEVGEGVDPAWVGARVAVETFFSTCGVCPYCRAGRLSVCEQRRSIGTHVDGGFAPRLVLPARNLHRVPDGLPDAAAALTEPLACVCNSLLDPAAVRPGDDVLVIGPGAIGLLAAQVARVCGGRVTVRGRRARRRPARPGRGAGVRDVGGAASRPRATSSSSARAPARGSRTRCARRGGAGGSCRWACAGRMSQVPYDLICFHELTVTAGFASNPHSWRRATALLQAGGVRLEPLVTEVVPLREWRRAFEASRAGEGVKFVLDPR